MAAVTIALEGAFALFMALSMVCGAVAAVAGIVDHPKAVKVFRFFTGAALAFAGAAWVFG